ncbi:hypothetical protein H6P81_020330 [Aristolochia fimbriata]|uniref:Uncharacterized protein n=1 Tax=Aristolochia fimbriata TaxID=158543 RepID=A0AAV7DU33_ARIFI|nr:hypothetical protein H6P81_020330 [Aristolochia fimbriata]
MSELRRESTSELWWKPWEPGKGVAIPKEPKVGFSLFDSARRWYIDVVSLKGELAVKIASKSPTQRTYVRIPLCEVESVRSNLSQLTKLGTPGKTKLSHNRRIEVGIFEEGQTIMEDEQKQREDPRVEGKEKGRSKVKEKKRTRRKISRIWRKKEASSAWASAPVPAALSTVGEGEDDRRQLAIVLPNLIGEGTEAESTISPNQEVLINEDGKRTVSERRDVRIPDCFIGTQEKQEMARKGSGPKTVGRDERHENEHVKANGNKEVESHEGPISNIGAEPTIEREAPGQIIILTRDAGQQADEEDSKNQPPKSVSDKTRKSQDGLPSTSRPLPASELRQSGNECENPKSVVPVSCAHARNHANRILRNPIAMYRSSPMKTCSVSVPLPSSNIKEVEEEDEDEERRI